MKRSVVCCSVCIGHAILGVLLPSMQTAMIRRIRPAMVIDDGDAFWALPTSMVLHLPADGSIG